MFNMDYRNLGLKVGLEVHQQLDTKHKLFCNCPLKRSLTFPIEVKRKLRPVAGELGQIDAAAMFQYLKDKEFIYQANTESSCLIELDEEPIRNLNSEALEIALQVAKLLKAEIPNEIEIMRKIIIDGSSVSSFQRTALIALNGELETSKGKIKIQTIALEEDSATPTKKEGTRIYYRLDRLGIPLIEIATEPAIDSPEYAKEVAERLGMICRSTGKAKRGIGTIRQDINVSIAGGSRVEIKGVQELDSIPKIIENEVHRQSVLKGKVLEETRVAKPDGTTEFLRPLPGGERMYVETDAIPVIIPKDFLAKIKLPETWEDKEKRLSKILPKQFVPQILRSEYLDWFEKHCKICDPVLVAVTYTSTLKDLRRKEIPIENINSAQLAYIFNLVADKRIAKEAIPELLEFVANNPGIKETEILKQKVVESIFETELRKIIKEVIAKNPELARERKISALMGDVMKTVRGKIDGIIVARILEEELTQ